MVKQEEDQRLIMKKTKWEIEIKKNKKKWNETKGQKQKHLKTSNGSNDSTLRFWALHLEAQSQIKQLGTQF